MPHFSVQILTHLAGLAFKKASEVHPLGLMFHVADLMEAFLLCKCKRPSFSVLMTEAMK